ncbi:hypothetical protein M758_UG234500 [Ceratodon purpureus]|nr:hypothetical protein M758_UG234500 [Ceratodon purpureus]
MDVVRCFLPHYLVKLYGDVVAAWSLVSGERLHSSVEFLFCYWCSEELIMVLSNKFSGLPLWSMSLRYGESCGLVSSVLCCEARLELWKASPGCLRRTSWYCARPAMMFNDRLSSFVDEQAGVTG